MTLFRPLPILFKLALILCCAPFLFSSCSQKELEPIKLGFLGGTTGRSYRLGVDGRDGSLLAIERTNAKGGINGRRIQLIVRDDKQKPETAKMAITALHNDHVAAVIGPFTSAMAVAITPLINRFELVTVGPTISTGQLKNIDDFFLSNYPDSDQQAKRLVEHIALNLKIKSISILYDLSNREHCESWFKSLQGYMEGHGGKIVVIEQFDSSKNESFFDLAKKLITTPTDGIFILANSSDTGLICQQLKKLDYNKPLFASEWSFTNDLLRLGGSSVEGITIVHTYDPQDRSVRFLDFSAEFEQRFGRKPSFVAVHAFDSTNFLLTGLKANPDPHALKKTLLELPAFEGLQSRFHLNQFGDVERSLFLSTVNNGNFVLIP